MGVVGVLGVSGEEVEIGQDKQTGLVSQDFAKGREVNGKGGGSIES